MSWQLTCVDLIRSIKPFGREGSENRNSETSISSLFDWGMTFNPSLVTNKMLTGDGVKGQQEEEERRN